MRRECGLGSNMGPFAPQLLSLPDCTLVLVVNSTNSIVALSEISLFLVDSITRIPLAQVLRSTASILRQICQNCSTKLQLAVSCLTVFVTP